MATVKVAVRVRPFNEREINMDSKLIIEMDGKKTKVLNPKISMSCQQGDIARERSKEFAYDYSYWSVDKDDPNYTPQEQVFTDLGTKVVESAFEGYNACVFAYGQTGSGKTYTMMGSQEEVGLIPRICESLFDRLQRGKEGGVTFRTEVSYLEIYNEKVKDLLKKDTKQHTLRLREHPKLGPYVQDLSKHLVMDYRDVEELMIQGSNIRTTAATKMNDTSSRSHAIFTLTFVQAKFDQDMPIETVSKIHLVDLAGSERADATGASGERLKEGGHINKSLVTLGSVISALADMSTNASKTRQAFIPYRDSVLTWLLKDSLGGNSKTIMIATVSPADCNYGETLSTLRYANRAKNIINKPQVNEDPNVKLIRDLKEEICKLKAMLTNSQNVSTPLMVERLHENEARVKVLTEEWTERWRETQKILQEQKALGLRKAGMGIVLDSDMPHLIGINDDLFSTGITLYHLKEGETLIGTEHSKTKQDLVLNGAEIQNEHCVIQLNNGTATLIPKEGALCFVDRVQVDQPMKLSQGCVILLGHNNMFRYNDPVEAAKLRREGKTSEPNRSRLSFLSWSMPDLAHSNEGLLASPSAKLQLARLIGDESIPGNRKVLEKRLLEVQSSLEEAKKKVKEDWDALYEKEKALLSAIDSAVYNSDDERKLLESIESEHQRLEMEENRLDEKEQCLRDAFERIIGDDLPTLHGQHGPDKNPSTNGLADNAAPPDLCKSVIEETVESEVDELYVTVDTSIASPDEQNAQPIFALNQGNSVEEDSSDKTMDCKESQARVLSSRGLEDQELMELKTDERIKELVAQEVQRQLLKEMANRLQEIRALREQDLLDSREGLNGYHNRNNQYTCRSLSTGCLRQFDGSPVPCSITIPSYVLRGTGHSTHIEYQIKIVLQDDSWSIFRRYRRVRELHLNMKKKYGSQIGNLYFPPRTVFGTRSEKMVKERQANLERYLQQMLDVCLRLPECALSQYNYESLTKKVLCDFLPFFKKGLFEIGKHGTA